MENKLNKTGKVDRNHPAFRENAKPFFSIVMDGLMGEVDGEHFWDAVAEDAIFEFMYNIPGFTNKIEGRKAYMDWFEGYSMELKYADNLRVYKDIEQELFLWNIKYTELPLIAKSCMITAFALS